MLDLMSDYIKKEQLFGTDDNILLTVSGGLDSMVMTELFRRTGYCFAVAHCNFKLRGDESDGDEEFVKNYCKKFKIPFIVKHFNTKEYAEKNGISIQMAARDLRYEWFEYLCESEGFACYATAHHKDDQIETFFINLLRGTGIAGLHGILPRQGRVIRPLLFAGRDDIEKYAEENNLNFREDSSNSEIKYLRNSIRHRLLPVLKEINPGYRDILTGDIERLRETEKVYRIGIERMKRKVINTGENQMKISIPELKKIEYKNLLLFEIVSEFGFNYSQTENIIDSFDGISGKTFFSDTHILIKDRETLIITKQDAANDVTGNFFPETSFIEKPVKIKATTVKKTAEFKINPDPGYAFLDKDKLKFPLIVRKWKKGDFFYPLGMNNKKKLSDFFIDEKVPVTYKSNSYVLTSGEDIVWIIGHRIDNRFKISDDTENIFALELIQQ